MEDPPSTGVDELSPLPLLAWEREGEDPRAEKSTATIADLPISGAETETTSHATSRVITIEGIQASIIEVEATTGVTGTGADKSVVSP